LPEELNLLRVRVVVRDEDPGERRAPPRSTFDPDGGRLISGSVS